MKLEREKLIRYGALAAALVLTVFSLVLWLLLRGQDRMETGFAQPRISPTPEITATPTPAQFMVTPAPTPRVVQVLQDYPPKAVDLVVDGRVLFTVNNPEEGRKAVEQYLSEDARQGIGPEERLIKAGFDQKLTLEEPSGRGELLSVEEAVSTLRAEEGLLPIVRTVVRCVIEQGEIASFVRENDRLAEGSRIYRSMGVYPYSLSYIETVYRGQAAFSEVKTNEFSVGSGRVDRLAEDGAYGMEEASSEAGPAAVTVEGFQPAWPVAGTVVRPFGMTDEGMHYGVEIAAESVARVTSPEDGVVVYCGQRGRLGLVIDIRHDDTGAVSRIIGCRRALVELHQRVKKGERVAVLPEPTDGRMVTIRYELMVDGLPVNPEKYLPKR